MEMDHIILPDLPAVDGLIVHTSSEGELGSNLLSSLEGVPGNEEIRAALTETDVVQQRKGWLPRYIIGSLVLRLLRVGTKKLAVGFIRFADGCCQTGVDRG